MLLKSQNEQEVQSRFVGYRWSITQTETASLGKRMKPTAWITTQYKSVAMVDFKVKEGAENMLITSTVDSYILTKSPIRTKSQIY